MVILTRKQLVGSSTKKSAAIEAVARANALNLTGKVNYNVCGKKDGIGFVGVTEKFIDNFLLRIIVPEYNTKNGKVNQFVGSQNRKIRELLNIHGLEKCDVKAISLTRLKKDPPTHILIKTPDLQQDVEDVVYFAQDFKIATPNLEYNLVMSFVRSCCYNENGFFLKDIDVTLDFAGSFDKDEVISHLVKHQGFRLQGEEDFTASRTVVDNNCMVGRNCMTFMEKIDDITVRQKIYNKMIQSLECQSVRSSVGAHWKDWVCQTGSRLADARDKSCERGLTRAEATFYVSEDDIPDDDFIEKVLNRIVQYVPCELVFSTPFRSTWNAYCSTMQHSLVCIDRKEDLGLIVNTYNEVTSNISGHLHEKWSEKEKWCLEKLTLNGNLPLDVIDITTLNRSISFAKDSKKNTIRRCDETLEVTGTRFFKINPDFTTHFTTRLVSRKGCYSHSKGTEQENIQLLETAGMIPHVNCVPYLARTLANVNSKTNMELQSVESLDIMLANLGTHTSQPELKLQLEDEAKRIEEVRHPLLEELSQKERMLADLKGYCKTFTSRDGLHLRDLEIGQYSIIAAKKQQTRFGEQYRLILEVDGDWNLVWGNYTIREFFDSLPNLENLRDETTGFLAVFQKPLGVLNITGQGVNKYSKTTVFCSIDLTDTSGGNAINELAAKTKSGIEETEAKIASCLPTSSTTVTLTPRENLLNYTDYADLSSLPIGSVAQVQSMGFILYYGIERMILITNKGSFQAGDDLESKRENITQDCYVKILRTKQNKSRKKYACCELYQNGDWTVFVDYNKTPIFTKFDGSNCFVDVRDVDIKGKKRKLLMLDSGDIYRMKKCKLEEVIKPGYY